MITVVAASVHANFNCTRTTSVYFIEKKFLERYLHLYGYFKYSSNFHFILLEAVPHRSSVLEIKPRNFFIYYQNLQKLGLKTLSSPCPNLRLAICFVASTTEIRWPNRLSYTVMSENATDELGVQRFSASTSRARSGCDCYRRKRSCTADRSSIRNLSNCMYDTRCGKTTRY